MDLRRTGGRHAPSTKKKKKRLNIFKETALVSGRFFDCMLGCATCPDDPDYNPIHSHEL
jgi:hypothetical protein